MDVLQTHRLARKHVQHISCRNEEKTGRCRQFPACYIVKIQKDTDVTVLLLPDEIGDLIRRPLVANQHPRMFDRRWWQWLQLAAAVFSVLGAHSALRIR